MPLAHVQRVKLNLEFENIKFEDNMRNEFLSYLGDLTAQNFLKIIFHHKVSIDPEEIVLAMDGRYRH